jgi:hypothetical protein
MGTEIRKYANCFNNFGQTNCIPFDNLLLSVYLFLQILNLLNNI